MCVCVRACGGGELLTEERQGSGREVWGPRDKKCFLGQLCVCVCVCVCEKERESTIFTRIYLNPE